MSEHETIADIIAEMRGQAGDDGCPLDIKHYAERLEAANRRELYALNEQITDLRQQRDLWSRLAAELVEKCNEQYAELKQVGDCAKLREAASYLTSIFDCDIQFLERHAKELIDTGAYGGGIIEHILHSITLARAALVAPPRNCDRFGGDIDKLREACARERGLNPEEDFPDVFPDWLLAPATEKEGGNNAD